MCYTKQQRQQQVFVDEFKQRNIQNEKCGSVCQREPTFYDICSVLFCIDRIRCNIVVDILCLWHHFSPFFFKNIFSDLCERNKRERPADISVELRSQQLLLVLLLLVQYYHVSNLSHSWCRRTTTTTNECIHSWTMHEN